MKYLKLSLMLSFIVMLSACAQEYTVTYDYGENVQQETTLEGQLITPPEVSKEGYTLDGWVVIQGDQPSEETYWNVERDRILSNIYLQAVWIINDYVLTFESNTGDVLVQYNITYNTPLDTFVDTISFDDESGEFVGFLQTVPQTMPAEDIVLTVVFE
jgi:hypothetical protein